MTQKKRNIYDEECTLFMSNEHSINVNQNKHINKIQILLCVKTNLDMLRSWVPDESDLANWPAIVNWIP